MTWTGKAVEDGPAETRITLRAGEALLEDVDTGVVRMAPADMEQLGAVPGRGIAVIGARTTFARVMPAPAEYHGRHLLQMDGVTRENAGVTLNSKVEVAAVAPQFARTMLIAPLEPLALDAADVRRIREALSGHVVVTGDKVKVLAFSKTGHLFRVAGTEPDGPVALSNATDVRIQTAGVAAPPPFKVKYEDIGGLEDILVRVRELVELPMRYPEAFAHLRIEPPKGVLLYGPPGTGKTLIARAVASEVDAHFIHVNGPEIIHKFYGESEAKLRGIFDEAHRQAPSIIFLDELDAIAPKRSDVTGEVEKRVVAQLLASMDGLVSRGEVVVIGATNMPEMLDPALRRPGRFDREISLSAPSRVGRLKILRIHSRGMPLDADVDLPRLAEITHGFVGADLEVLCKEAGMRALQELLGGAEFMVKDVTALVKDARVTMRHFLEALKHIDPTATREFFVERPNVSWADAGGLEEIRRQLESIIEFPRKAAKLFARSGIRPPKGVMLSGPSGTGKTLIARALAAESGLSFITADAAMIFSKWVGESEKALRQVFRKAKEAAPCILLFDEIDAIVPTRRGGIEGGNTDRIVSQFLNELDNLTELSDVIVLGATNRLDLVDPAVLTPGRFGFVIEFRELDKNQRQKVFEVHAAKMALSEDVSLAELAAHSDGFTAAEIAGVCQRAAMRRIHEFVSRQPVYDDSLAERFRVTRADFEAAMEEVTRLAAGRRRQAR
jgi:transitional endoplasmic reticulum ATPase